MKKMTLILVLMTAAFAAQAATAFVVTADGAKVLDTYGAAVLANHLA
jgi:hypothetical protein